MPIQQFLGIDIGGTKTSFALEDENGTRSDITVPTTSWRECSDTVKLEDLDHLLNSFGHLELPIDPRITSIAIGMHGAETESQIRKIQSYLREKLHSSIALVNDAELISMAEGIDDAINLVIGTGTICLSRDKDNRLIRAGGYGYGWLLDDYCSAPALVRESMKEMLSTATTQGTDFILSDPLFSLFLQAFHADDLFSLTFAFGENAQETAWGHYAPFVFDAANAGSPIAHRVIRNAIDHVLEYLESVQRQGATGSSVVAAGGVILHQRKLQEFLAKKLRTLPFPLTLHIANTAPVEGALRLAHRIVAQQA